MIGEIDWFGRIVGGVADGDVSMNARVAKALIRAGLGVVIIEPNGKKAVCTLNARDKKAADVAAQDEARKAGSPNWERVRHACGIKHVITDEKMLNRAGIKRWLEQGANIAVAPGTGERRIIIVDVDTEEERRAFLEDCEDIPTGLAMTVSSPGVMETSVDGEKVWAHKNGGHYWFDVPEGVDLPTRSGKITWCRCHGTNQPKDTCPRAWAAYYGSGYVLVPPSVRKEGAYTLTGGVQLAPEWLTHLIASSVSRPAAEDGREGLSALNAEDDPIDTWSRETTWNELLTEDGFTPFGHDTCGCPTFTRPGSPVHAKSATAHEEGCTQYDTTKGHGPLRIWSDALGSSTLSKLSYVARYRHDGDMGQAMRSLGINRLTEVDELSIFDPGDFGDVPKANAPSNGADSSTGKGSEDVTNEDADKDDDKDDGDTWCVQDLGQWLDGDYEPVKPDLMPRTDGQCLLYSGELHSFHGESESGKSLIVLWEAGRLMQDGHDVLWIDFDSDARENVGRLRAYGVPIDVIREHFKYVRPEGMAKGSKGYAALFRNKYKLAVLDGVTDAILLVNGTESKGDPNSAYVMFSRRLPKKLMDETGAAVVMIDHVVKDGPNRGRFAIGAQAKMSQLSGAAYTVLITEAIGRGMKGEITLHIGKDRPGQIRPYAGKMDKNQMQEVARVTVDDTGRHTVITINPQGTTLTDPFSMTNDMAEMETIAQILKGYPKGLGIRQIMGELRKQDAGMNQGRLQTCLDDMVASGQLIKGETGPRGLVPYLLSEATAGSGEGPQEGS